MELLTLDVAYVCALFFLIIVPIHEFGHYMMMWAYGLKPKFGISWNYGVFFAPNVSSKLLLGQNWLVYSVTLWGGILLGLSALLFLDGLGAVPAWAMTAMYVGYLASCSMDVAGFMEALAIKKNYGNIALYKAYGRAYEEYKAEFAKGRV